MRSRDRFPHRCAQLVVHHCQVVLQPVDLLVVQQTVSRCSQLLIDVVQVLLGPLTLLCCGAAAQIGADALDQDPEHHTYTQFKQTGFWIWNRNVFGNDIVLLHMFKVKLTSQFACSPLAPKPFQTSPWLHSCVQTNGESEQLTPLPQ